MSDTQDPAQPQVAPTAGPATGGQQATTPPQNPPAANDDSDDEGEIRRDYPKVKMPDTFDGTRSQLVRFLAQVEIYISFNKHRFDYEWEKVLWTGALLRGAAFDWFAPFLIDYTNHKNEVGAVLTSAKTETKLLFRDMRSCAGALTQVFGEIDQDRNAERSLLNLKQKGSAANYTSLFQQHAVRVAWNDESLRAQYYKGLKDAVKDEMARSDRPENLGLMMEMAIRIDNRMYERTLEKKGFYGQQKQGGSSKSSKKGRWPEPMELDATTTGNGPSKDEMERRRREGLCYECGKPGHRASIHRNGKSKGKGRNRFQNQLKATFMPEYQEETVTPLQLTPEQEHACLSWTACYNDHCLVHISDKQGSGWYPRRPKAKKATKNQASEDSE